MKQTFGVRLKHLRESLGISGYRLAKDAGLAYSNLHHIESGKRVPTDEVLAKIAPILGVALDELKAWANADRLGEDGIEGLERYVLHPERQNLGVPDSATEPPTDLEIEALKIANLIGHPDYRNDFWLLPSERRSQILIGSVEIHLRYSRMKAEIKGSEEEYRLAKDLEERGKKLLEIFNRVSSEPNHEQLSEGQEILRGLSDDELAMALDMLREIAEKKSQEAH